MIQFKSPVGSQELPSVSSSKHTEHNWHAGMIHSSAQVLSLIEVDEAYAARYKQCCLDVVAFKTVVQLVAAGQCGVGYKQEHTSFRGMQRRAGKIYKLPLDEELNEFRVFLMHVGPKPHYEAANPLSLDRINNLGGYVLGNVNWADKAQQSANRRTRKFNLVNGSYVSDLELARHLTNQSNKKISVASVKKNRQRGLPIQRQFELCGLPYISGLSPKVNWRFPLEAAPIAATYLSLRRRHEAQIDFYVRVLRERIMSLRLKLSASKYIFLSQKKRAEDLVARYTVSLRKAGADLERLDAEEFEHDLIPLILTPAQASKIDASAPEPEPEHKETLVEFEPGCGFSAATRKELDDELQLAKKRRAAGTDIPFTGTLSELIGEIGILPLQERNAMVYIIKWRLIASESTAFFNKQAKSKANV